MYAAAITELADEGVITGFRDGTFGPQMPVTRQQFAKMILISLDYRVPPATHSSFGDVEPQPGVDDPLYPIAYVEACAKAGITLGTTANTFCPWDSITRAQLITMVARAVALPDPPAGFVAPFEYFSAQHYPWALRAYAAGLLDGFVDMGPRLRLLGSCYPSRSLPLALASARLSTTGQRKPCIGRLPPRVALPRAPVIQWVSSSLGGCMLRRVFRD